MGDRALPPNFVSTHGERLGPIFYVIDELDNCLVLEDNQPIQVHLDPDCYVPELMDPETLDNVSRVFHIKYTRMDEDSSPDVIVLSGSEPSDDQFSSDGDEDNDQDGALVGDNLYNPIDLSSGSSLSLEVNEQSNAANKLVDHRYAPEVSYEKKITASDVGQSRLYLASKFTAYLKLSGDGSIWTITGPDSNVEKNVFFFHLLKSGGRGGEWKFGVGFCLKIEVSHANGNNIFVLKDREVVQLIKTRCSSFSDNHPELNQGSYCKVVPLKLISSLLHKKVVFMVDARPVGYEMNRSVYIVQQIWDDASVINVFEAAAEMNEHKTHVLVDSMPKVEDAFSQCGSDHEAVEDLDTFYSTISPSHSSSPESESQVRRAGNGSLEVIDFVFWLCDSMRVTMDAVHQSGGFCLFQLSQKQHDKVQAIVEDDLITTFIHQLKEGHVFIISDFKVIPNGGLVRVTRHRFRILFKCSTSVVAAANRVIPNPGLNFVGVLCGLKRKTDVECNGKILKVIVLEVFADGKKIPCNLVGDCSALIDINSLKKYHRPPVLILQSFKIKVNGDKVSLQNVINISRVSINPNMQETVNFLNEYRFASHHFSRLCSNEIGDLVCIIDDESFDWKLIRTIANLKGNNEDEQFFVVGKIKEIVEDPEWWVFSCVCGHPIVGDDNVFHCQLCGREVQHFMTSYRIKILVEDGTSCGMFVLLDSAVTKLLGRTSSILSTVFHQLIGKEIIFKVQAKQINSPGYCGTFKIVNVISDAHFFNKLQPDQCIKDVSSDLAFSPILEDFSQSGQLRSYNNQVISGVPIQLHSIKEMLADILCAKIYSSASRNDQICFLIGEIIDVVKHQKWWYYCCLCNAPIWHVGNLFYCYLCRVECVDAIRRYRIKIIVSHSNGSNIFILEDDEVMQILKMSCSEFLIDEGNSSQSKDDYTVPNRMISQLMNKKIVFIVDPRPIGYELNTSLHVVRAICDDIDIVKFLEDSMINPYFMIYFVLKLSDLFNPSLTYS
ncbi:Replication factor-A carboxy-terminal domain protein [Arachis hypogaea]|nr:Replication factor-A carboxy-terminal domain protein [Arachis hypogaea]